MSKIELIDSHAHLMDEKYENDLEKVIQNALEAGIEKIINIGYSKETSINAVKLAKKYEYIYAVVGMHPDECNEEIDISFIEELTKIEKVVAIGEIGLDYHYEGYNKELQKKYFVEQIKLANKLKLPIVIHSRDADMDMLEILKNNKIENNFVMHCFSSSVEVLKEVLKLRSVHINCWSGNIQKCTFINRCSKANTRRQNNDRNRLTIFNTRTK